VSAKILFLDIETSAIQVKVWALGNQYIVPDRIVKDWHLMSFAAKWHGSNKVIYMDQRRARNISDDSRLLSNLWMLLDEADIVITQNGKRFDIPKIFARMKEKGFDPPSTFKQVDTCEQARKLFGFTSNKLEYLTARLCKKYKKLKHKKFPGNELWDECEAGNVAAWDEMAKYNKHDVLALEELYDGLAPWDRPVNLSLYVEGNENVCSCGGRDFVKNGFYFTNAAKYQRFRCVRCRCETHSGVNLLSKEKRASLMKRTVR
jgi:hypothetical protein